MFARTIRLQKRAHTESSERGKSSLQPRSADPSLREERGGGATPQLQISFLLADLPRPIISPLRLRALLQRLDLLSNLGLSPPAVSAPAAVRLLCSLDRAERGGQIRAEEVVVVVVLEGESFLRLPLGSGKSFPSGASSISRRRGIVTEWRPQPEDGSSVRCHTAG